jgi:DNA-binding CsgD family transcriptional regulator
MEEPLSSFLPAQAAQAEGQGCVEVIHSGPAVHARLKQVAAVTRSEMLSLEPSLLKVHALPDQEQREVNSIALGLARRGVRQPSVMSDQLESRRDAPVIQELAAAGSPARYSPSVPLRVLVVDRRVAFFPLVAHDTRRGAYVTTASTLVQLACRLFDDVWQRAVAIPGLATPDRSDGTADEQRQRVLDLLAQGCPDERIAREMGVSIRTVGRVVAQLQTEFGAHSRFQLAVFAEQAGLIALRPTLSPPSGGKVGGKASPPRRDATEPSTPAAR